MLFYWANFIVEKNEGIDVFEGFMCYFHFFVDEILYINHTRA